ncbi:MAG: AtpZ/AtpI family protein [bacterium]|nr:MAG: AtpZ/AtpI family protein [bacterium]
MAKARGWYDLLKYSSLGLEMGAAVVIGLLFGVFLDRKLGTEPWLTLLFLAFGFAAAAKAVVRAVRSGILEDEPSDGDELNGDRQ